MRLAIPKSLLPALLTLLTIPAWSHEFWLQSQPYTPNLNTTTSITLKVGENFEGDPTPFVDERTSTLRQYANKTVTDLSSKLPRRTPIPRLDINITTPGLHLIAFDSQPIDISLPADKFHAYLHDEGLDNVIEQRTANGKAATPGRERYRRHVKTLVKAGDASEDNTYATKTGQRLEIIPLSDPYKAAPGTTLRFHLNFESQPLKGALVKAWHKHDNQLLIIKARTDAAGEVALSLPYAGEWMVSVVHMIPATGTKNADWDSFWGNITFMLPPS